MTSNPLIHRFFRKPAPALTERERGRRFNMAQEQFGRVLAFRQRLAELKPLQAL